MRYGTTCASCRSVTGSQLLTRKLKAHEDSFVKKIGKKKKENCRERATVPDQHLFHFRPYYFSKARLDYAQEMIYTEQQYHPQCYKKKNSTIRKMIC